MMILLLSALAVAAPSYDVVIRLEDRAAWIAEPSWLGNPADRIETARGSEGVVFRVLDAGRGMKWRMPLEKPIPLAPFRFVTIRFRTFGSAPHGDYALAILGGPEGGREDYRMPIPANDLHSDGKWRHATGSLGDAAGTWVLRGLAFQVQAGADPAEVEVAEIRFTRDRPLAPLAEILPFERVDPATAKDARFEEIDFGEVATFDASTLREAFGLAEWFPEGGIKVSGIPFRIRVAPRSAAATGLDAEGSIPVPLAGRASEIALLLAARFAGNEEPSLGSGELREIRDVDRAIFRIEYAEGPADEMLCLSIPEDRFAIGRGPQIAILFADSAREMKAFEIVDRSAQVDLVLVAATAVRDEKGCFATRRPTHGAVPPVATSPFEPVPPRISLDGTRARIETGWLRATVDLPGLRIESIENAGIGGNAIALPSRLLRIAVGGRAIEPEAWSVLDARIADPVRLTFTTVVRAQDVDFVVRGEITCPNDEIFWSAEVENRGNAADVEIVSPEIAGLRARNPATDLLFYPKRGAVLTAEPCSYSRPGSGLFPVQFMDLSAAAGGGIYVRTEDREGLDRLYEAAKGRDGARLAVVYPSRRLDRGATRILAPTGVGAHGGDWHEAFRTYMRWLASWHRPRMPLKTWFREVFNFRQRFFWFWDPLYEKETGKFRMAEAVAEVDECFGGMEYLHLMDWGSHPEYGRVYGRTGDHAPWDAWKGGPESLAKAMPEARAPVGMYVEGYLLEERGKLGQGPGKTWQILGPGGERRYWPGATEMFVCPWVGAWKETQVDTYRRLARMFPVRGFYIDQFGFADWGKMCWSPDHGHPVPAAPLRGEIALTRAVDNGLVRIDPDIAIYTEETPCDLANGWQDGSFTYAMNDALRSTTGVPLNIARFAFPAFKTFEILVCDQPTGSWATGVLWTFWNGEGIWLEGPAREWFRPRTLDAIRKTHAILRRYRDAFTTLEPEPLVETRVEGLYANRFPARGTVVYTIWNALPRTFRGHALAIPKTEGDRFFDAWNERELAPRPRDDGTISLPLEIPPHGVACVVAGSARGSERPGSTSIGRPVRVVSLSFARKGRDEIVRLVDAEAAKGADLIALPETWQGPEPLDGPTVKAMASLAAKHKTYIVCPIDRKVGERRLNSAVLIDRRGAIAGVYDKVFPYWSEFDGNPPVAPGDDAPVFETDFGRIELAICFDVNFPEVWQRLADRGAEIVVWPSAYSAGTSLQSHAINHHYHIVTSTWTRDCIVYDITGEEILYEKSDDINVSRITLDLDRGIYHQNFNIPKRDRLLREHGDDVEQEKWLDREQWFVLKAKRPGVSARRLAAEYGLEELRGYIDRSRRAIDARRGSGSSREPGYSFDR